MVTPEIPPLRTTGGLADAVHGLSRALVQKGHCVSVFVPAFTGTMEKAIRDVYGKGHPIEIKPVTDLSINLGMHGTVEAWIMAMRIPFTSESSDGALKFFFIDTNEGSTFGNRIRVYGYRDDAERYFFFNRVIAEFYKMTLLYRHHSREHFLPPDIMHHHDWGTGYLGYMLRHCEPNLPRTPLIYNIHNLAYREAFAPNDFFRLTGENNPWVFGSEGMEFYGKIDPHKAAILFADRTVTVSPTYREEILSGNTVAPADQFAGVLKKHSDRLRGILNGIPDDYGPDLFHEKRVLPASYSHDNLEARIASRRLLQETTGLNPDESSMIIVSSGRWAEQKGTDMTLKLLPSFLQTYEDVQFITVGSEAQGSGYESSFNALKNAFPGRVAVINFTSILSPLLFGENLEALAMAGGDAYFMPSIFEPCGLGQMKALKLGMPVIANRTGGLADTVEHNRTGFLMGGVTEKNVRSTLNAAHAVFKENPDKWNEMRAAGMRKDFSWSTAADKYLDLYEEAIEFWITQGI